MPDKEITNSAEYQIQAVWCSVDLSSGENRIEVFPKKVDAKAHYLITNEPSTLNGLYTGSAFEDWYVVDVAELFRILFPESPIVALDEMLPPESAGADNVSRLWNLWQRCNSKIDALPAWVLDTVGISCREMQEEGLSALFFRLSSRREGESRQWSRHFPRTVTKVERPQLPQLEDCAPLDPDFVASFQEEGGPMSNLVEGYEPRPGQIKMLKAVTEAFNEGRHLLAEAGTGVGKSLAYLLPSALWAKLNDVPVVVSTNTKNLQTQLVEKDLPAVMKMIAKLPSSMFASDKPLSAAVIKGRSNYICLKRLGQLIETDLFELDRSELRSFAQALCWAANTMDGDLDVLTGGANTDPAFVQHLVCSSEDCHGRACRHYTQCFIQKARERSLRANLIIANHSLVFTELDAEQPIAIPDHAQIVFDEAHNLEEAATKFFTREFSPAVVTRVLRRFHSKRGRALAGVLNQLQKRLDKSLICTEEPNRSDMALAISDATAAVDSIKEKSEALFEALYELLGKNNDPHRYAFTLPENAPPEALPEPPDAHWRRIRERHLAFNDSIGDLKAAASEISRIMDDEAAGQLKLSVSDTSELDSSVSLLDTLLHTASTVLAGCNSDYVFWVQNSAGPNKKKQFGEACAAPLNVGEFLAKYIYEKKSSVILSSATLSVGGRFNYIASRIGLDQVDPERIKVCIAPSPFDYLNQSAVLVPQYLPEPASSERSYVSELSDLIYELALKYDGRTICLFTSFEMLKNCARKLEERLKERDIHLLVHGESGSRNMLTREFRKGERTVLLGTQSFWEGVDVVGDALSCVVVARLPFTSPGDPVFSARCEQIERSGKSSFSELSLPSAVLKLRQGFGRLIRHRNDRGCVVIADTRIITKNYGAVFRNSLPCPSRKCPDEQTLLDSLILPK